MATIHMHLDAGPFANVKSGKKQVEFRLNDEKRQKVNIGDTITFTSREDGSQLTAQVTGLHRHADFATLYDSINPALITYTTAEALKAKPANYTAENIQKYGTLGIQIQLI